MNTRTLNHPALVPATFALDTAARRALAVALGAAFVALLAQVAVRLPGTPVPVTGQTLGVLLVGAALGRRLGAQALVAYLAAGAAGLPVFAGGGAGPGWLLGPSGGYLLAFPLAAGLTGALVERFGSDRRFPTALAAMLAASATIYALGLAGLAAWLAAMGRDVGFGELLAMGLYPFLAGDLFKAALAAALLPASWRFARRWGRV
ncbi:biotin transporter BioY [Oceanithermus sp.]|uniref:biotin transporter BioY n=1 Tax=Oceanithermus sp. TaxID=2268145 RepID=UPI0025D32A60|nr:biotin transporter BioY [Oceanithermus sp.]